jgi:hypothetical protein
MQYKVIPFVAAVAARDNATAGAAAQLEALVSQMAADGWVYVRLEQVETHIAGTSGCFGLGATPAQSISLSMAVFQK